MDRTRLWERATQSPPSNSKQRVYTLTSARQSWRGLNVKTRKLPRKYSVWNQIWTSRHSKETLFNTRAWRQIWQGFVRRKCLYMEAVLELYLPSMVSQGKVLRLPEVPILTNLTRMQLRSSTQLSQITNHELLRTWQAKNKLSKLIRLLKKLVNRMPHLEH